MDKGFPKISREKLVAEIAIRMDTPDIERDPYTDKEFCHIWNISQLTYIKWKKKIIVQRESELGETEADRFMNRMYELAMEGRNAKYAELWARIKGVLKDKSEVKVDLTISADDFVRRNLRAESELGMEGYRVSEMPKKPPVLPKPLCLDSGQGSSDESSVASVESLTQDS